MRLCQYKITKGPARGSRCETPLIATCSRSQPSQLVEWRGTEWTKKHPQMRNLYPEDEEQSDLCFYHQQKETKKRTGGQL